MACNSIATTSTTISQVILSKADLQSLVSKLIAFLPSKPVVAPNLVQANDRDKDYQYALCRNGAYTIYVEQTVRSGKPELEFTLMVDNGMPANKALSTELNTKFAELTIKAQQTNVLKRLAELGKLSNVQGKANGVVAKLEITL